MLTRFIIVPLLAIFLFGCKTSISNKDFDKYDPAKTYKLQLNPQTGTSYNYDIITETTIIIEAEGKEVENLNKSTAGINYTVSSDSTGNLVFTIKHDNISVYTKNGDTEVTAEPSTSGMASPVDRMLGILKDGTVTATLTRTGQLLNVNGYQQIGEKIIAQFPESDLQGKNMAKEQWEKLIGQGMIKRNLDQLFRIFPDSAVHLNDTWTLRSRQEGEYIMNVTSSFVLKAINSEVAIIQAHGKIKSDTTGSALPGYGAVTTRLQGEQEAEFEMETSTGMLMNCTIKAGINGTISIMGREVPVTIKTTVKMKGKKI